MNADCQDVKYKVASCGLRILRHEMCNVQQFAFEKIDISVYLRKSASQFI
jgi:hypothetical protein